MSKKRRAREELSMPLPRSWDELLTQSEVMLAGLERLRRRDPLAAAHGAEVLEALLRTCAEQGLPDPADGQAAWVRDWCAIMDQVKAR